MKTAQLFPYYGGKLQNSKPQNGMTLPNVDNFQETFQSEYCSILPYLVKETPNFTFFETSI